jgi:hypothetical protein
MSGASPANYDRIDLPDLGNKGRQAQRPDVEPYRGLQGMTTTAGGAA